MTNGESHETLDTESWLQVMFTSSVKTLTTGG